ncbi:macro domain-containing protein, partial [Treponema saccharophilum]
DVECVVSPANSYGLMDGGYDAAITAYFGDALIPHVQEYIRTHFFCEQPVGTSFLIDIPGSAKKLIHTPTMRVPSVIREPLVVYQCTRTTLISAMQNDIKSLVIPAFGGSCGNVPPQKIALLMRGAFDQLWTMPSSMDWNYANRGLERI